MVICYEEHQPWFTKEASWHKIDIYSMKTATQGSGPKLLHPQEA